MPVPAVKVKHRSLLLSHRYRRPYCLTHANDAAGVRQESPAVVVVVTLLARAAPPAIFSPANLPLHRLVIKRSREIKGRARRVIECADVPIPSVRLEKRLHVVTSRKQAAATRAFLIPPSLPSLFFALSIFTQFGDVWCLPRSLLWDNMAPNVEANQSIIRLLEATRPIAKETHRTQTVYELQT